MSFRTSLAKVMDRLPELVLSKDGSVSQTKLAAACFHLLLMLAVIAHTVVKDFVFDVEVWMVYGGFAVGHAGWDKYQSTKASAGRPDPQAASQPLP